MRASDGNLLFRYGNAANQSRTHPVISDGRLYVRNQDIVKVYDIKSPATR